MPALTSCHMLVEKLHSGCNEKTHPPADTDIIFYIVSVQYYYIMQEAGREGGRKDVNQNKLIVFRFENPNFTPVM